jgi:hypothetical protein
MTGNLFYWLMETKSWIFTGQDEIKNKIIFIIDKLYNNLVSLYPIKVYLTEINLFPDNSIK